MKFFNMSSNYLKLNAINNYLSQLNLLVRMSWHNEVKIIISPTQLFNKQQGKIIVKHDGFSRHKK